MKKCFCKLGLICSLVIVTPLALSQTTQGLSPTDIANEYSDTRAKRISGYFGEAGGQIVKTHETRLANYLATKVKAKKCRDIQKYIPSLDTGYYIFKSDKQKAPIRNFWASSINNDSIQNLISAVESVMGPLGISFSSTPSSSPYNSTVAEPVAKRCLSYGVLTVITSI